MIDRYDAELKRAQAGLDLSSKPGFVRMDHGNHYEGAVALPTPVSGWELFREAFSSSSRTILRDLTFAHAGEETLTGEVSDDILYEVFGFYRAGGEERYTKAPDSIDNSAIEKIRKFVSSDISHTRTEVEDAITALDIVTVSAIYKTTQWGYLHNLVDIVDLQLAFVEKFQGNHPESAELLRRLMPLFEKNVLRYPDDTNMDRIEYHQRTIMETSAKVKQLMDTLSQRESKTEEVVDETQSSS